MSKFTKQHYEDVATLLKKRSPAHPAMIMVKAVAIDFADLFATDNPACCIHCGYLEGTTDICDSSDGRIREEHLFEGGFDREQFLAACGLA
ncbi:hypothetical protein LCGC14_1424500 [marine sediment metagenome]|uniref:Uncharacterized protein n=1 Tax=marine sediment metagenome TaxID=412755 RepID=A0A0F9JQ93_9ZZZZ